MSEQQATSDLRQTRPRKASCGSLSWNQTLDKEQQCADREEHGWHVEATPDGYAKCLGVPCPEHGNLLWRDGFCVKEHALQRTTVGDEQYGVVAASDGTVRVLGPGEGLASPDAGQPYPSRGSRPDSYRTADDVERCVHAVLSRLAERGVAVPRDSEGEPVAPAWLAEAFAETWGEGYSLDWTGGVSWPNPYQPTSNQPGTPGTAITSGAQEVRDARVG